MLVEIPAALLVVAEIVILFAGVVARYGLHRPLIWSDELASILFLWLAMLGAAVAFRRAEHMRMTAVVANARPAMRAYLDLVATSAALAFLHSDRLAGLTNTPTRKATSRRRRWRSPTSGARRRCRSASRLMALFALLRLAAAGQPHGPCSARSCRSRW